MGMQMLLWGLVQMGRLKFLGKQTVFLAKIAKGTCMKRVCIGLLFCFFGCCVFALSMIRFPHCVPLLWKVPYFWVETLDSQPKAIKALNDIRRECKAHYLILSAHRSKRKNDIVGGVKNSMHTKGIAFDVIVPQSNREEFYSCAKKAGFTAFGWGGRTVHIDMGKRRWWTYGDDKKHRSGDERYAFLHKAPRNFKKDFALLRK